MALLDAATTMHVTSRVGTELTVSLAGAFRAGSYGWCTEPGSIAHWPGGLVLAFPASGSVNGTVVLAPYLAAFDEPDAYAVSHVGWGMDPGARWEALATRCGRCRSGLRSGSRTRREEPSCSR